MMEIYSERMERMENPDLTRGYLKDGIRRVRHAAIEERQEKGRYEEIARYQNGGRDVRWVVEVPRVKAREAWEEEIPIQIYVPYTQKELEEIEAQKNVPTQEERIERLEHMMEMLSERVTNLIGTIGHMKKEGN